MRRGQGFFDFAAHVLVDKVNFIDPLSHDVHQSLLLEVLNQICLEAEGQVVALDRLQVDQLHRHWSRALWAV